MGAGDGNRGANRPFADRLPYGIGALAAAWFVLFSQSSQLLLPYEPRAGEAFVASLCGGVAVCGLVAALLCLKDPYCPQPLRERCPRLCAALLAGGTALAIAGALLAFLGPTLQGAGGGGVGGAPGSGAVGAANAAAVVPVAVDVSSPLLSVGGLGCGAGLAMVALVAFDQVARRSLRESAAVVSSALVVFATVHGVLWFCSGPAVLAALVAVLVLGALLLARSAPYGSGAGEPRSQERGEGERTTVLERLSSIARSSWGLYAVLLISMFLLGFNWDPVRLGLYPVRPELLVVEESLGALVAALILRALCRLGSSADALACLQWTIAPAVVATFIVVPYFPLESTGGFFYEFVGFVRCASIFVFAGGFLVAQSAVCRAADASLPFSAGLALVLCGGCLSLGFVLARTLGSAIDMLVVLLFVCCLVAMVVARSVSRGDAQKVRRIEREVFDAYLQQRCAAIAAEYGLSPRESEILLYLSRGHGYVYIAELAFVSEGTVRTHAKSIFRKCGVSSREELIDLIDERPS